MVNRKKKKKNIQNFDNIIFHIRLLFNFGRGGGEEFWCLNAWMEFVEPKTTFAPGSCWRAGRRGGPGVCTALPRTDPGVCARLRVHWNSRPVSIAPVRPPCLPRPRCPCRPVPLPCGTCSKFLAKPKGGGGLLIHHEPLFRTMAHCLSSF